MQNVSNVSKTPKSPLNQHSFDLAGFFLLVYMLLVLQVCNTFHILSLKQLFSSLI
ncbi:hypothetical protein FM106_06605 [Brachybacterium faecium]|nr:hypothetical protein FM106_06605 [Brachybacterium faecium]